MKLSNEDMLLPVTVLVKLILIFTLYCRRAECGLREKAGSFMKDKFNFDNLKKKVIKKEWQFEMGESNEYPGHDLTKLAIWEQLWSAYVRCMDERGKRVADTRSEFINSVVTYESMSAKLICSICVSPAEETMVRWYYAKVQKKEEERGIMSFFRKEKDHIPLGRPTEMFINELSMELMPDGTLIMHHLAKDDAGVYYCRVGQSMGFANLLDVYSHDDQPELIKARSIENNFKTIQLDGRSLTIWKMWSDWSECSVCDRAGRRRKLGMCYVKWVNPQTTVKNGKIPNLLELSGGLPCESIFLEENVKTLGEVKSGKNMIKLGYCKIPCPEEEIFEVWDSQGELIETANNSAGIYSTLQSTPRPLPNPGQDVAFGYRGDKMIMYCSGITLIDAPITWKIGKKEIWRDMLERITHRRVSISLLDNIVYKKLVSKDTNLYSCWQRDILVGTVRLVVKEKLIDNYNLHLTLAALALVSLTFLYMLYQSFAMRKMRKSALDK